MNCILCEQPLSKDGRPDTCMECFIHYFPSYQHNKEGAYYFFNAPVINKVYVVKYYVDPQEMAVFDYDNDKEVFRVPYTRPTITPFNAAKRLPVLIPFS